MVRALHPHIGARAAARRRLPRRDRGARRRRPRRRRRPLRVDGRPAAARLHRRRARARAIRPPGGRPMAAADWLRGRPADVAVDVPVASGRGARSAWHRRARERPATRHRAAVVAGGGRGRSRGSAGAGEREPAAPERARGPERAGAGRRPGSGRAPDWPRGLEREPEPEPGRARAPGGIRDRGRCVGARLVGLGIGGGLVRGDRGRAGGRSRVGGVRGRRVGRGGRPCTVADRSGVGRGGRRVGSSGVGAVRQSHRVGHAVAVGIDRGAGDAVGRRRIGSVPWATSYASGRPSPSLSRVLSRPLPLV